MLFIRIFIPFVVTLFVKINFHIAAAIMLPLLKRNYQEPKYMYSLFHNFLGNGFYRTFLKNRNMFLHVHAKSLKNILFLNKASFTNEYKIVLLFFLLFPPSWAQGLREELMCKVKERADR